MEATNTDDDCDAFDHSLPGGERMRHFKRTNSTQYVLYVSCPASFAQLLLRLYNSAVDIRVTHDRALSPIIKQGEFCRLVLVFYYSTKAVEA